MRTTITTGHRALLVVILAFTLGLVSGCGNDTDAPAAVSASPEDLAREVCHKAWLATLESPEAVEIDPMEQWPVEVQPNQTLLVKMSGRVHDMLDEMVDASWECVVLPEGDSVRLVTLTVVEL
jgi:hypothetical protein